MSDSHPAYPARHSRWRRSLATATVAAACLTLATVQSGAAASAMDDTPFVGPLNTISTVASTIPENGDVNPYGTAIVPVSRGDLHRGDVLVSNFNASSNLQGTGTTIVQVDPKTGTTTTFATIDPMELPGACPGGVGLTTALSVLRNGWVFVGSLPTADGTSATVQSGCLLVLDDHGTVRETITGHGINGPWDMTAADYGDYAQLFVTNVLNGTVAADGATVDKGTVVRLSLVFPPHKVPKIILSNVIASGFGEHTDPAALVVGPTGVGLSREGTLYVADSVGNRVTAIPDATTRHFDAGTGRTVTFGQGLNTPLGLAVAPNGDILTVNAADGNLIETTPRGTQVATRQLDDSGMPPGAGALFGLAVTHDEVFYVDDASNSLNVLSAP
jgi:hypothetical protein